MILNNIASRKEKNAERKESSLFKSRNTKKADDIRTHQQAKMFGE